MANALTVVKAFKEEGCEVSAVEDGTGARWVG
jgi:hypothetical protein